MPRFVLNHFSKCSSCPMRIRYGPYGAFPSTLRNRLEDVFERRSRGRARLQVHQMPPNPTQPHCASRPLMESWNSLRFGRAPSAEPRLWLAERVTGFAIKAKIRTAGSGFQARLLATAPPRARPGARGGAPRGKSRPKSGRFRPTSPGGELRAIFQPSGKRRGGSRQKSEGARGKGPEGKR